MRHWPSAPSILYAALIWRGTDPSRIYMRSRLNSSERSGRWNARLWDRDVSECDDVQGRCPANARTAKFIARPRRARESLEAGMFGRTALSAAGCGYLERSDPAFFIGRNHSGFWVARDANGKSGGLFWSREAALRFARATWPDGCATIFPQGRFELDIENGGNPLISWLEAAKSWLARRGRSWLRLAK